MRHIRHELVQENNKVRRLATYLINLIPEPTP
jgi:hypothetical protein